MKFNKWCLASGNGSNCQCPNGVFIDYLSDVLQKPPLFFPYKWVDFDRK